MHYVYLLESGSEPDRRYLVLVSILDSVYRIITQASLRTRPSTGPGESLPTSHFRIVRKLRHLSDISSRGPATRS